jgi:hypothetical protein
MIRGESVVLVAEQARTGGAVGNPAPKSQELPSFRESLMTSFGMSYDAATAYIEPYNDMVDQVNALAARYANAAASSLADAASDLAETDTPSGNTDDSDDGSLLSDAQPFEYQPDSSIDDVTELAARGVSEEDEAECFAQYNVDMVLCAAGSGLYKSPAYYLACKERASKDTNNAERTERRNNR